VASGGDTWERARRACLHAYAACADRCEAALSSHGLSTAARADLIVCAAVCRVAHRALHDGLAVAQTVVEYSIDVCHRAADAAGDGEVAHDCRTAAAAATELLLVS